MEQVCKRKRERSEAENELKYRQNKRILNEGLQSLNLNQYTTITDDTDGVDGDSECVFAPSPLSGSHAARIRSDSEFSASSTSDDEAAVPLPPEEEHLISVMKGGQIKYLRKVDFLVDDLIRKTHRTEVSRTYCPKEFDSKIPASIGPSPTVDHLLTANKMPLWPVKIFDSVHFKDSDAIDLYPHSVMRTRSGSNAVYVEEDEEEHRQQSAYDSDIERGTAFGHSVGSRRMHHGGDGALMQHHQHTAATTRPMVAGDPSHCDWGIEDVSIPSRKNSSSSNRQNSNYDHHLRSSNNSSRNSYSSDGQSSPCNSPYGHRNISASSGRNGRDSAAVHPERELRYILVNDPTVDQFKTLRHSQQAALHGCTGAGDDAMCCDDDDSDNDDVHSGIGSNSNSNRFSTLRNNGSDGFSRAESVNSNVSSLSGTSAATATAASSHVPYYIDANDNLYCMMNDNNNSKNNSASAIGNAHYYNKNVNSNSNNSVGAASTTAVYNGQSSSSGAGGGRGVLSAGIAAHHCNDATANNMYGTDFVDIEDCDSAASNSSNNVHSGNYNNHNNSNSNSKHNSDTIARFQHDDINNPQFQQPRPLGRVRSSDVLCNDDVGSSRVDLQACKLEYSIVSPK